MSQKSLNMDLDLSLMGSQCGTPVSSTRKTDSAKGKKPNSPSTRTRSSSGINSMYGKGKGKAKSIGQSSGLSHRSDVSSRGSALTRDSPGSNRSTTRDDVLALFANSSEPKVMKPKAAQKKTAWGSAGNTTRSTSDGSLAQSDAAKNSAFSHSIFEPASSRSNSTVDEPGFDLHLNLPNTDRSERDLVNFGSKTFTKDGLSFGQYLSGRDTYTLTPNRISKEDLNRSRNSLYWDNSNGMLNSNQPTANAKATKLNSIANNMTSLALSPGTKMPILGMENSYQNIKHKHPINQVRQSPQAVLAGGSTGADDYTKQCNMAAIKIQRCYRRHLIRRKSGERAMRRLLETKKQEKEDELQREKVLDKQKAEDRKRIRDEKARLARQQAILELQKKREEKRQENVRKAEEEIAFLQANGKVGKTAAHNKSNVRKRPVGKPKPKEQLPRHRSESDSELILSNRSATANSVEKTIDEFFQNNTKGSVPNKQKQVSPSDREDENINVSTPLNNEMRAQDGEGAEGCLPPDSPSQAATRTTLEDLMETLRKLEEDEKFEKFAKNEKNEKPLNWLNLNVDGKSKLDELEKDPEQNEIDDFLSIENLQKLNPSKSNIRKSGLLTDEKLRSIITYLDEVETAERISEIDHELNRANEMLEKPALLVPSGEELDQLNDQAAAAAEEVTSNMLAQRLELQEKKRSVGMLQKALNQQRELTVRHARETEKEMQRRLNLQKDEYEETIKRHLGFIDQLIDDKKSLGEKCEQLVKEMKTVDKKYADKIKTMQDNHDVELKKIKDLHEAAEKLRRAKWIDEKTKKIKEMTVKGLEPEIQILIAKHMSEIKKLKSIHEAELLASDERAGQKYIRMTEELRDQLQSEKEAACHRERELARQTYEKQMQQEEAAYQQQRRRLYEEVQEEKERISQQATRQRTELDKLQRQLEDSHSGAVEAMRVEYEKAREEQERRHNAELRQIREQVVIEKTAWEENYMKKQESWLLQKERELKEQVRRDRDKEIELVIQRLEDDSQATRHECERVADNRIKRIRDKYDAEIEELERSERQTTEKYNSTKAKLAEVEGENERLKVTLRQKDRETEELKKLLERLNNERDRVADVIRQEFADRLVATEEENKRVKNDMSEMKARHRLELERAKTEIEIVQKAKEEEMEEVHKRVKQAIVKKEDVVQQLRHQYQAAVKRADHLEGLLEQQRKQLLSKK